MKASASGDGVWSDATTHLPRAFLLDERWMLAAEDPGGPGPGGLEMATTTGLPPLGNPVQAVQEAVWQATGRSLGVSDGDRS